MNSVIKRTFKLDLFHQLVELLIEQYDIPTEIKRLALNLKVTSFYSSRSGIQPVEVQLERANPNEPWEVRFIASFDYPTPEAESVEVSLYFNFKHQWFYQPDIQRCELNRPEVQSLFISWLKVFTNNLKASQFDTQTLTIVSRFK
ncbi:DUF2787 family protein [Vibrio crassostreae]|uniref:DUF2787 family protein n=1 Tax=Vibrio crassostreae TaxID=246167 RepID=A0A822MTT2_9VIBR|nr:MULTISPECIES: DUF2787 family protein [Vibrio]MCC5487631.1 DUF2787 domain-containing protein [Vibrio lentus]MCC5492706.1 DUF2787 domain-containing protein [Vibrio lentus]MDH5951682.1 DUF2787 domain-containing protein [Vibrio crassostreae]TCN09330.1 uncharacterized protein DUF2787 [Vibrio crassostreae]TCU10330.1 uncharacterized protein DUF2787 [Vibrio crassostreae]